MKNLALIFTILSIFSVSLFGQASGLSGRRFAVYCSPQIGLNNSTEITYFMPINFNTEYIVSSKLSIGLGFNHRNKQSNGDEENYSSTPSINSKHVNLSPDYQLGEKYGIVSSNENCIQFDLKSYYRLAPLKGFYHLGVIYGFGKYDIKHLYQSNSQSKIIVIDPQYYTVNKLKHSIFAIHNGFGSNYPIFKKGIIGFETFLTMGAKLGDFPSFFIRWGLEFKVGVFLF